MPCAELLRKKEQIATKTKGGRDAEGSWKATTPARGGDSTRGAHVRRYRYTRAVADTFVSAVADTRAPLQIARAAHTCATRHPRAPRSRDHSHATPLRLCSSTIARPLLVARLPCSHTALLLSPEGTRAPGRRNLFYIPLTTQGNTRRQSSIANAYE
jgi:hypothetical protein